MIGKERIEYWTKGEQYISDLRRGTKGTGASDHPANTLVIDMSAVNLLPPSDVAQAIRVKTDGVQTVFPVPVELETAEHQLASLQVYLGGRLVTSGYTVLVQEGRFSGIEFDEAPKPKLLLTVIIKQGANWYNVLSPESSLQDSNTLWAEFIREKPTILEVS
jgi:hypothetical protein